MNKNNTIWIIVCISNLCFPISGKDVDSLSNNEHPVNEVIRDSITPKDRANVFWNRKYTLFDYLSDEPIFPNSKFSGKNIYKIYYSSNEDPTPYSGFFDEEMLESLLFYKFKNLENCMSFCKSIQQGLKRDPAHKERANVFWNPEYTLYDLITDEPIYPIVRNGIKIYKIYYSSNDDPNPYQAEFPEYLLPGFRFYKFKNESTCLIFCGSRKNN